MDQLLTNIVPLALFMLIPVWIPIIAIVAGRVVDQLRPTPMTPAGAAVAQAKARSATNRGRALDPGHRTVGTERADPAWAA